MAERFLTTCGALNKNGHNKFRLESLLSTYQNSLKRIRKCCLVGVGLALLE